MSKPAPPVVLPAPVDRSGTLYLTHAAGRTQPEPLQRGVDRLEGLGFSVQRGQDLAAFHATDGPNSDRYAGLVNASTSYLAGPDVLRVRDITHALTTPGIDAVIAARGGYGCMRILERLPWSRLADSPRWVVGYSDITALHLWSYAQGVASIHGPMVAGLDKHATDGSVDGLLAALAGHPVPIPAQDAVFPARFEGPLIGGNLSLLAALRPTRFWPKLDGAILFIEEIGEPLYRIDRMLQTLRLAGGLNRVAGFAIGQLTACGGKDEQAQARALDVVLERLGALRKPIIVGLPCGHGSPNASFIHGARYAYEDGLLQCVQQHEPHRRSAFFDGRKSVDIAMKPLMGGLAAGVYSAAQLWVSQAGNVTHNLAIGATAMTGDAVQAPVAADTLFDIASVTKAVSTAVLAHLAVDRGLVSFGDTCPADLSVSQPTLADLLAHRSGLPAHEPIFRMARRAPDSSKFASKRFAAIAADTTRNKSIYSDIGYIALGRWLERLFDSPLDRLFDTHIAAPLGLSATIHFTPPTHDLRTIAATEFCAHHGCTLQGRVHDENCQVLGGVSGHAGLFATAAAVGKIANSLLGFGPPILSGDAITAMWDPTRGAGSFTLGWDTPSGPRSNAGSRMRADATVGHLGFTGCSLWLDRDKDVVVVLNTNRVHPHRDNAGIRWVRPAVHDAVLRELGYP